MPYKDKDVERAYQKEYQRILEQQEGEPKGDEQPPAATTTKAPGKPVIFHPGVDPVPVPFTVPQHPLYSDPQAAKPV